jgi:hypothetical protein
MASDDREVEAGATVLRPPASHRWLLGVGAPLVGAAVGYALPLVARWLLDLSVPLPMRGLLRLVARADLWWEIAISVAGGLVIGVVAALAAIGESAAVIVGDRELRLRTDKRSTTLARAEVSAVFLERGRLVVLDGGSREVARESVDIAGDDLIAALRRHGYPWRDGDPHAGTFQRWARTTSGLPPAVHALLSARERALKRDDAVEAAELRRAVEELGFTVRDEGRRQFWRPLQRG